MSSLLGEFAQRETPSSASVSASQAHASLSLQQQSSPTYLPPNWDALSPEKQAEWNKALHEYYDKPFWAVPLLLPPEIDLPAQIQDDLKFLALLIAIRKVSDQQGVSVAAQLDTWNYGRGEQ